MENNLDPRLHFVVATAIIHKPRTNPSDSTGQGWQFEYLIAKRAAHEKAYPDKWTVPGGKLVLTEYQNIPKTTGDAWYNISDWLVKKEVMEEVGVEIGKPKYLCDLVFVRPDGYPVVTLSYYAGWARGDVKLCKDLSDYAWVTVDEAQKFDLIDGIWEEIRDVDKILKSN